MTTASEVPTRRWIPALDGVRGLAIILVMLDHFGATLDRHDHIQRLFGAFCDYGWTGVDLFFVLSGFLITGILLDTRSAVNYFRAFYARRILRIFPIYYASLPVIFLLVAPRLSPGGLHPREWLWYVFYVQNWAMLKTPMAQHYWSLAVEEQFYLVWPLVVYRFELRQVAKIAVAASVLTIPLRFSLLAAHVSGYYLYRNTFTRMDSLLIGAACACLVRDKLWMRFPLSSARYLWIGSIGLLGLMKLSSYAVNDEASTPERYGYTIIAIAFAGILLSAAVSLKRPSALQWSFETGIMRRFGRYSYSAYVWHRLVGVGITRGEQTIHLGLPWFVNIPLMIAATLFVSIGSYVVIERPFLSLKRHFQPRYALPG